MPAASRGPGFAWPLALIALVAAGVRLAGVEAARPLELFGDEVYYAQVADHLARGRGHVYVDGLGAELRAWRPPAHAWLLSLFVDASADESADATRSQPLLVRWARLEAALGTALVVVTGLLGRALFDARTGLVAAAHERHSRALGRLGARMRRRAP